jgi:hypothetical protein
MAADFVKTTYERQNTKDNERRVFIERRQKRLGFQQADDCCSPLPSQQTSDYKQSWEDDSRHTDIYLQKYFYRQRQSSISSYPDKDYR